MVACFLSAGAAEDAGTAGFGAEIVADDAEGGSAGGAVRTRAGGVGRAVGSSSSSRRAPKSFAKNISLHRRLKKKTNKDQSVWENTSNIYQERSLPAPGNLVGSDE